jgi:hypothetical protein
MMSFSEKVGVPKVSLDRQIACVKREVKMREKCYPGWIGDGRMASQTAERELDAMRAVLDTLRGIAERQGSLFPEDDES